MDRVSPEGWAAIAGLGGSLFGFVISKITKKTSHESTQNSRIDRCEEKIQDLVTERQALITEIETLKFNEKSRDTSIIELKAEMKHTQAMILTLNKNHQDSFLKLIELIEKIDNNRR